MKKEKERRRRSKVKEAYNSALESIAHRCPLGMLSEVAIRILGSSKNTGKLRARVFYHNPLLFLGKKKIFSLKVPNR